MDIAARPSLLRANPRYHQVWAAQSDPEGRIIQAIWDDLTIVSATSFAIWLQ